jgi:hypothetical protein
MKGNREIRKWILYILLINVFFSFSGCCTCQNSAPVELKETNVTQSQQEYVPDELLIKFKKEVEDREIKEILDRHGFTVIKKIEGLTVYQVKISGNTSVLELIEILSKDSRIEYVEPNYLRKAY